MRDMEPNFRASMNWLHTWAGVVLATVLFTIFWMGTLSVFDREIDRWAIAETRFDPQPMPSFDTRLAPIFESLAPGFDAAERTIGLSGEPTTQERGWLHCGPAGSGNHK